MPGPPFVKICGITNRDDALAAVDSGAHALGFIFYPRSPRAATPDQIADFIADIPAHIWKVGVFVNEPPHQIEQISQRLRLDVAQLHGEETPDQHPDGLRIWKAFRVKDNWIAEPDYPAEAILLDGPASGQTFDWSLCETVNRQFVLAGGLDPENVRAAIERTHPWAVDVSSAIESAPGRKDHLRMKKFIEAALRS